MRMAVAVSLGGPGPNGPAPSVPVLSVAPVISGNNSVGDVLSVTDGTWTNSPTAFEYRPTRGGTPIAGETANAYTLAQPDDPGETIGYEVRAENAAGWSSWATATGAVVCRPYWTAIPTFSGTNAVGQTLTGSAGTVLGSTSTGYEWIVAGSGTGDTDTSYTVQVADAGDTVVYRGTASNAGGSTTSDSASVTVVPYWSVDPSIDAGSENWPGGTMTADGGTVAGETSGPTYEWILDSVGTGDTDGTYVPPGSATGDSVLYRGTASNAGGASNADSAPITIVQVEGVTRALETDNYLTHAAGQPATQGTLLVEMIPISASAGGSILSWGRQPGANSTRREIALFATSGGAYQVILRNSTSIGTINISSVISFGTGNRYMCGADWNTAISDVRASFIDGATLTQNSTIGGSGYRDFRVDATDAIPTMFRRAATLIAGGLVATEFAGTLAVAYIARRYTTTEWENLRDAGSLEAAGVYSDPDLVWYGRPATSAVAGDALTNTATQLATSWTIVNGPTPANLTIGTLNEAI